MVQRILFLGNTTPNISRHAPFKLSVNVSIPANSAYSLHPINRKFVNSYTMMLSSKYCFEVTVHQILAELCPIENFGILFCFQLTSFTVYIRSTELYRSLYMWYVLLLPTGARCLRLRSSCYYMYSDTIIRYRNSS